MTASKKKVVLVTGASSGMGKATALKLAREGHVVYGAARRVEKMRDLVDAGGRAVELDVTEERPYHQHHIDGRQNLLAPRRLVPCVEARA